MPGYQFSHDLLIQRFGHGLKIDGAKIAALFRKVAALVKYVSHTAAHAGGKIPPARSQYQHEPLRHVLAAVIANSFHHGSRPRVANRESLSGHSVEKRFSAGCAVERNISDQDVFFGSESGSSWRIHDYASTGQAFADVVVRFAFERQRDAVRQKCTQALSRRSRP